VQERERELLVEVLGAIAAERIHLPNLG
jgi:hypothetical protein